MKKRTEIMIDGEHHVAKYSRIVTPYVTTMEESADNIQTETRKGHTAWAYVFIPLNKYYRIRISILGWGESKLPAVIYRFEKTKNEI